jgi:hypothetical protein
VSQILVTNTVLSLVTIVLKLAISWVLLRAGRMRRHKIEAKKLQKKKAALVVQAVKAAVSGSLNVGSSCRAAAAAVVVVAERVAAAFDALDFPRDCPSASSFLDTIMSLEFETGRAHSAHR